jgi:hypothetical protein
MANQANQRSIRKRANFGVTADRPQLTAGPAEPVEPAALSNGTHDRDRRDQPVA